MNLAVLLQRRIVLDRGLLRAQLCTAVESSTGSSPASAPANWDMYSR
jgi:hypothetical protein